MTNLSKKTSVYQDNFFVYAWGRNKNGELGIGTFSEALSPAPSAIKKIPLEISPGGKHTLLLSRQYELFSCGIAEFGVLGNYSENNMKSYPKFAPVQSLEGETITAISCAEFHSLCLTKDGLVCSWGGNLYNKLGQPGKQGIPSIIKSLYLKKVAMISCGDHHTVALTQENEVFTWGGGNQYNHGQCGFGNCIEIESPRKLSFFRKNKRVPIKIRCGGYHTLVLCIDNKVYSFGKGDFGQCGYGGDVDALSPVEVEVELEEHDDVKDIQCGGEHSAILTEKGRLYTFGNNYNGQLGHGNNLNFYIPTLVESFEGVVISSIALGWSHTVALTNKGYLYGSGCNAYGELGIGNKDTKENFTLIEEASKLNIQKIFAGGHHTFITINNQSPVKQNYEKPEPLKANKMTREKEEINRSLNKIELCYPKEKKKKKKKKKFTSSIENKLKYDIDKLCLEEEEDEKAGQMNVTGWKKNLSTTSLSEINQINQIILKIFYTTLPFTKRFVRFCIQNQEYNKNYNAFLKILSEYLKNKPSIISHELVESYHFVLNQKSEKFKDFDGLYKEIYPSRPELNAPIGTKEYILSLTSSKDQGRPEETKCMKVLTLEDIQKNKLEQYKSEWALDFLFLFQDVISSSKSPSFIELR